MISIFIIISGKNNEKVIFHLNFFGCEKIRCRARQRLGRFWQTIYIRVLAADFFYIRRAADWGAWRSIRCRRSANFARPWFKPCSALLPEIRPLKNPNWSQRLENLSFSLFFCRQIAANRNEKTYQNISPTSVRRMHDPAAKCDCFIRFWRNVSWIGSKNPRRIPIWEEIPTIKIIPKNKTDQSCGHGSFVTASANAMKAKPGPPPNFFSISVCTNLSIGWF